MPPSPCTPPTQKQSIPILFAHPHTRTLPHIRPNAVHRITLPLRPRKHIFSISTPPAKREGPPHSSSTPSILTAITHLMIEYLPSLPAPHTTQTRKNRNRTAHTLITEPLHALTTPLNWNCRTTQLYTLHPLGGRRRAIAPRAAISPRSHRSLAALTHSKASIGTLAGDSK